jgi:Mn-dependent DtxR family transcriptional regulator
MLEEDILNYLESLKKPVTVGTLAKDLNLKHSTANSAIKRLVEKGYVRWELYKNVELLAAGVREAEHLKLHQHLISLFLIDTLNISETLAHREARKIASAVSCELIDKICEKYDHPSQCSCGEDLPSGFLHDH